VGVLLQDHEICGAEFQRLAYHRILIMLFLELKAPEQVFDTIIYHVNLFLFFVAISFILFIIYLYIQRYRRLSVIRCIF
jgi:hypothetical protein